MSELNVILDPHISCDLCGTPLRLSSIHCPSCRSIQVGIVKSLGQGLRKKSAGGVILVLIIGVVIALWYAWNDA